MFAKVMKGVSAYDAADFLDDLGRTQASKSSTRVDAGSRQTFESLLFVRGRECIRPARKKVGVKKMRHYTARF